MVNRLFSIDVLHDWDYLNVYQVFGLQVRARPIKSFKIMWLFIFYLVNFLIFVRLDPALVV